MSKMWDIAQYVEANPDRHDQRWRLCKKLYTAKEYRMALEHLLVLKNEWDDRKRVRRYLAATLYRLERYKEAVHELHEAINIWPEEVALREQLAQALYKSGDLDACAEAWGKIAEIDPKHRFAGKAAKAILAQARGEEQDQFDTDALGHEMDEGFGMSVELTCPQCNAKNSDEFDRCWNCHAPLGKGAVSGAASAKAPAAEANPYMPLEIDDEDEPARGKIVWVLLAGAALAGLCFLYLFAGLMLQAAPTAPAMTLQELLATHMSGTRAWLGAVLMVLWTFLLAISVDIFFKEKPTRIPEALCVGSMAGGTAFALTWLPLDQLPFAFAVPAFLTLPLMFLFLPLKPVKILGAWALHLVLVFGFGLACAAIVERSNTGQWFNPIAEYNRLLEYAKVRNAEPNEGVYTVLDGKLPMEKQFKLEPTGSPWLDLRATGTTLKVTHELKDEKLRFEVEEDSKTRIFELLDKPEWSQLTYNMQVGKTYNIKLSAESNKTSAPAKVEISSLLFLKY